MRVWFGFGSRGRIRSPLFMWYSFFVLAISSSEHAILAIIKMDKNDHCLDDEAHEDDSSSDEKVFLLQKMNSRSDASKIPKPKRFSSYFCCWYLIFARYALRLVLAPCARPDQDFVKLVLFLKISFFQFKISKPLLS